MALSAHKQDQLKALVEYRGSAPIANAELYAASEKLFGKDCALVWIRKSKEAQLGRGLYDLKKLLSGSDVVVPSSKHAPKARTIASEAVAVETHNNVSSEEEIPMQAKKNPVAEAIAFENVAILSAGNGIVPEIDKRYVNHPNFAKIEAVLASNLFFPMFITGLSGNGKTLMIEQVCAQLQREFYRVNITVETDEDDLLGGFRLINGDTVWQDGPVLEAMQRGGVLLLDEIDLASNKIMCLQSVLEGKGVFLKKLSRWVKPAKGFTVFATANTKGKGDLNGGFVGTTVLNEAFLDRFKRTVYQDYPEKKIELKILKNVAKDLGVDVGDFSKNLVDWANGVRKAYAEQAIDEVISTRRLVTILESYSIFKDKKDAIEGSIERFDTDTKEALLDFYKAVDANFGVEEVPEAAPATTSTSQKDVLDW